MDRGVVPAVRAQLVCVGRSDLGRSTGELDGVVAQGADRGGQVRPAVIVRRMAGKRLVCALSTEVVCMRANSVMAVVLTRDDDGEQLTLLAR